MAALLYESHDPSYLSEPFLAFLASFILGLGRFFHAEELPLETCAGSGSFSLLLLLFDKLSLSEDTSVASITFLNLERLKFESF